MCHLLVALHVITVHGPDFRAKFLIHNELSWRINIALLTTINTGCQGLAFPGRVLMSTSWG